MEPCLCGVQCVGEIGRFLLAAQVVNGDILDIVRL